MIKTQEGLLQLLTPALDEISNGVTLADAREGTCALVFVNRAFERVTGYSRSESLGKNCRFLQGSGTDPKAVDEIRAALREGRSSHVCLRNYRKDGTAFLNELKILPIRDPEGEVVYFMGIQNDVTAHLLARALRQSDASQSTSPDWQVEHLGFSLTVDSPFSEPWHSRAGVVVADHRGQVCYGNRVAGQLLGTAPGSLKSSSVFDHFDADWFSEALRPEAQSEHEWLMARLCGESAPGNRVELSTYRVQPDLGSRPLYVILLRGSQSQA